MLNRSKQQKLREIDRDGDGYKCNIYLLYLRRIKAVK